MEGVTMKEGASAEDSQDQPADATLDSRADTAAVIQMAVAAAAEAFLRQDHPDLYAGGTDAVHEAAVALSQLRSYLRAFRRVLDPVWVSSTRRVVAPYAGRLEAARQLHAIRARLDVVMAGPSASEEDPMDGVDDWVDDLGVLRDLLGEAATTAGDRLAAAWSTPEHRRLVDVLLAANAGPPLRGGVAQPAKAGLPRLLVRPWRDFREAARVAKAQGTDAHLQALLIRSRRLQHAAGATSPVLGNRMSKVAEAAAGLHDQLAVLDDVVTMHEWLDGTATARPELAYTAGKVWMLEAASADTVRRQWRKEVKEVRRRWRRWRQMR
jgi:hypothetical protein